MKDIFQRTELLIGTAGLARIRRAQVIVFGLGGVGSYVVEALARAGVGSMILVDSDVVQPSNLNRQLYALQSTINQPKVILARERIREIDPRIEVEAIQQFYLPGNPQPFFQRKVDYIVDAVDTVAAKVDLIIKAQERNIPLISSLGAGNRLDPTCFRVGYLTEVQGCPLAKAVRRGLRKAGATAEGIRVVYSVETPRKIKSGEDGPAIGSISFVPPVAGLIMAGVVIRTLLGLDSEGDS
jgi:tRNA A37 threonylcarbamoyladenosine dehydratase